MSKFVNKFLSKTYHMITQCDEEVASWIGVGDSFRIKDVARFETNVLPKYFNHSKFSSFVRQLNFYGFQKVSMDTDILNNNKGSTVDSEENPIGNNATFSHEYFRRGMPELMPKIQRSTANKSRSKISAKQHQNQVQNPEYESLQKQIANLQKQVNDMESQVDVKVEQAVKALRNEYLTKVTQLGLSYQNLLQAVSVLIQGKPSLTMTGGHLPMLSTSSLQQWRPGNNAA